MYGLLVASLSDLRWEVYCNCRVPVGCQFFFFFQLFVRGVKYWPVLAFDSWPIHAAKKRRKMIRPNAKPGIIKRHLLDNLSMLPENNEWTRAILYVCLCESSRIRTVKELLSPF